MVRKLWDVERGVLAGLLATLAGCSEGSAPAGQGPLDSSPGSDVVAPFDVAVVADAGLDASPSVADASYDCRLSPTATLPPYDGAAPAFLEAVYKPKAANDPYPNELSKGTDLHRLRLTAPDALCNDGTPAEIYVRPGTAGHEKKWVIYLQGGGGCVGHATCLSRFLGEQEGGYDATKMSTRYNPDRVGGVGSFERRADNPIGDWNQVYVYYCSSDAFSGTNPEAILWDPSSATSTPFRIRFLGRRILEGALAALQNGSTATLFESPGVRPHVMPPFREATTVLLTGSSAGAEAVRRNVDWMASRVPAGATFGAMTEAVIGTPAARFGGERGAAFDTCQGMDDYYSRVHVNSHRAQYDESCLSAHEKSGDPWRCAMMEDVLHHHITTPMLLRHDLSDPKSSDLPQVVGLSRAEWFAAQRTFFQTLVSRTDFLHDPEPISRPPSLFAPNCGEHIVFHKDAYYNHVIQAGGGKRSMNDALLQWFRGEAPFLWADTSDTGAQSTCPK